MYAQSSLLLCNTSQSRRVDLKLVSRWIQSGGPETFYLTGLESSLEGLGTSKLEHLDGRCYSRTQCRQWEEGRKGKRYFEVIQGLIILRLGRSREAEQLFCTETEKGGHLRAWAICFSGRLHF